MKPPRPLQVMILGLKAEVRFTDLAERALVLRKLRDLKKGLSKADIFANDVRRQILLSAIRLRSKRPITEHQRWDAASFLIAVLSSGDALKAVTKYLKPRQPPIGRLVAEDYAAQRALGGKAIVANRIVGEAWGLNEKQVKDHWTHWRCEAEKSIERLLRGVEGLPGNARDRVLRQRSENVRRDSLTRLILGEPFQAWSRKRNTARFRPRLTRPIKKK